MPGVEELLEEKLSNPLFLKTEGNVTEAALDQVKAGLLGLPEVILEDFLNSDFQILVANREDFLALLKRDGAEEDVIEAYERLDGHMDRGSPAFDNIPTVFVMSDDRTQQIIPDIVRHEVGHGMDHINVGYNGFKSENPDFRRAYDAYQTSGARERLMHEADIAFSSHIKEYEPKEGPRELVAEMLQKYGALRERGFEQSAERIMSHDFPHVWDAMKRDMPQIEDSLFQNGLDPNGRPLDTTPENMLTHKYLHRGGGGDPIYVSVHGLSANEIDAVEEAILGMGITPKRELTERREALSALVIAVEDVEKFRALREDMITARGQHVSIDPMVRMNEEQRILEALMPNLTLEFKGLSLAEDGSLLLSFPEDYDTAELGRQIGITDLSDSDRIDTSSSGETKTIAVAFNRLPDYLQADLTDGFNTQSGRAEQRRVSAQKLRPDGGEDGEEPGL